MTESRYKEFAVGKTVLLACTVGIALGASPVPFNMVGTFTLPITSEFGWGRGDMQLALFCFTLAVVATIPFIGALMDRVGVRQVAIGATAAYAGALALMALAPNNLFVFYAIWVLIGIVGAGSTPISWTRAINDWFPVNRGLALAIALMGTGLTAAFLPSLAAWLIAEFGWRKAVLAIAAMPVLIALPLAWHYLKSAPTHIGLAPHAQALAGGVTLGQAARQWRFWAMMLSILLVALGIGGLFINFQPMLIDKGFDPKAAAQVAGAIGISIIIGRLVTGWLIDRFWAPGITLPLLALPAFAAWLLMQDHITTTQALIAAALVGAAAGAESDLLAFLAARYFGLKHYGRIYGVQYAAFGLASGLAPFLAGKVFDHYGSYNPALPWIAGFFVVGALLLLTMGRYPEKDELR